MRVEYHPEVERDVADAIRRYGNVSKRLADEFEQELRASIAVAASHPGRFHLLKPGLHRANLRRFPYHFLYRELNDGIRVMLVRPHRRSPQLGLERS